jgi:hypothetical protein
VPVSVAVIDRAKLTHEKQWMNTSLFVFSVLKNKDDALEPLPVKAFNKLLL